MSRPGEVERRAVLDYVAGHPEGAVVAVVAPAGYGKTMLLRQWMDRRRAPAAWISLDPDDNDPIVLLQHLASALQEVVPIDDVVFQELAVEYPSVRAVSRRLANSLARADGAVSVVLDDVHVLGNPACHEVVAVLIGEATPAVAIAVASREELPVPTARLRAQGRLAEVGALELAMDQDEAVMLAARVGVELSADAASDVVAHTEGWPVALYLIAQSHSRDGNDPASSAPSWRDRPLVEYVHEEFLAGLDADDVQFLTRTSVLERLSGPSCDAVLDTSHAADRLEQYAHSNLLVVPLDNDRTWYRYHHLFQDLLRTELERREPELVPTLLSRAATWAESHDLLDVAVEYAMAADDADHAARIVGDRALALYRSGRSATLGRWFTWFEDGGHMPDHPQVATAAAWMTALTGQAAATERWAAAAEASRPRLPDDVHGDQLDGLVNLMRATLCRQGIDQAQADIQRARRQLPIGHPWQPSMTGIAGIIEACQGNAEVAERLLVETTDIAAVAGAAPAQSVALAERALLAVARNDRREARSLATAALDIVEHRLLQDHATNVLVFAVAARVASGTGETTRIKALTTRAQRLRPLLGRSMPLLAVQARLALARALLTVADGAGARTMMREIDEILRIRPGMGALEAEVEEFRPVLDAAPAAAVGASTLTTAELRVLPLLRTHLTFREIGERLFVSQNTVKTQAISVYRKLGVSSRSAAVTRAIELGLLEP